MKTILRIISIAVLALIAESFLPWWSIAIVSFAILVVIPASSSWNALLSGFAGIFLLWLALSWKIDFETASILTEKVANIFQLDKPVYLIVITALTGGLTGAFAAWCGHSFRKAFFETTT